MELVLLILVTVTFQYDGGDYDYTDDEYSNYEEDSEEYSPTLTSTEAEKHRLYEQLIPGTPHSRLSQDIQEALRKIMPENEAFFATSTVTAMMEETLSLTTLKYRNRSALYTFEYMDTTEALTFPNTERIVSIESFLTFIMERKETSKMYRKSLIPNKQRSKRFRAPLKITLRRDVNGSSQNEYGQLKLTQEDERRSKSSQKDRGRPSLSENGPNFTKKKDLRLSRSSQKDYGPSRSTQKDYGPSRSTQKDYKPSRSSQNENGPSRSSQKPKNNKKRPNPLLQTPTKLIFLELNSSSIESNDRNLPSSKIDKFQKKTLSNVNFIPSHTKMKASPSRTKSKKKSNTFYESKFEESIESDVLSNTEIEKIGFLTPITVIKSLTFAPTRSPKKGPTRIPMKITRTIPLPNPVRSSHDKGLIVSPLRSSHDKGMILSPVRSSHDKGLILLPVRSSWDKGLIHIPVRSSIKGPTHTPSLSHTPTRSTSKYLSVNPRSKARKKSKSHVLKSTTHVSNVFKSRRSKTRSRSKIGQNQKGRKGTQIETETEVNIQSTDVKKLHKVQPEESQEIQPDISTNSNPWLQVSRTGSQEIKPSLPTRSPMTKMSSTDHQIGNRRMWMVTAGRERETDKQTHRQTESGIKIVEEYGRDITRSDMYIAKTETRKNLEADSHIHGVEKQLIVDSKSKHTEIQTNKQTDTGIKVIEGYDADITKSDMYIAVTGTRKNLEADTLVHEGEKQSIIDLKPKYIETEIDEAYPSSTHRAFDTTGNPEDDFYQAIFLNKDKTVKPGTESTYVTADNDDMYPFMTRISETGDDPHRKSKNGMGKAHDEHIFKKLKQPIFVYRTGKTKDPLRQDPTTTASSVVTETSTATSEISNSSTNVNSTTKAIGSNDTTVSSNTTSSETNVTSTTNTTSTTTTTVVTTTTAPNTTLSTTTSKTTTTKIIFDVDIFLDLLANLTYDYETNLTLVMNMTLRNMSVPTCGTPKGWYEWMGWPNATTEKTTTPTTTEPYYEGPKNLNGSVIAKCFVCGLRERGIPYSTDCADAFAGDFLPLVPVNPLAKSKAASYRKYCRYGEIYNYFENTTRPKSVYGRWTGGCSVRWTDLTGLYTQRTCRNRRRAVTGEHYASKRMAKLEMALSHVDEGCIITPVATLLPLSRGISLYSRFHACVCTGNWCNAAAALLPAAAAAAALATAPIWQKLLFSS